MDKVTMMNTIFTQLAIYCMLFSAFYLARTTRQEQEHIQVKIARASEVPHVSSLVGVDSSGHIIRASTDGKTLTNNGRILLFVLHSKHLQVEVTYWNAVRAITRRSNGTPLEFWGICDAGGNCNSHQDSADFTIVGYLDAQQMSIIADAGTKGESLLYGNEMGLKAVIHNVQDPASEATLLQSGITNNK
jgi:hypothetical protein